MNVSAEIHLEHAFVLRSVDVETIWSALDAAIGGVSAKASCCDGIQREFRSAEQLTTYDNVASRAIRGLSVRARATNPEVSASVTFNSGFVDGIGLSVEGPEDLVIVVRDKLHPVVADLKPWYALICRIDFFFVVGLFWCLSGS